MANSDGDTRCAIPNCRKRPCVRTLGKNWRVEKRSLNDGDFAKASRYDRAIRGGGIQESAFLASKQSESSEDNQAFVVVCLLHYYTHFGLHDSDTGSDKLMFVSSTAVFDYEEYQLQKVQTDDLVRDMICEIEEEFEGLLHREYNTKPKVFGKRDDGSAVLSKSQGEHRSITGNSNRVNRSALDKKSTRLSSGVSKEDLYLWQMEQQQKNQTEQASCNEQGMIGKSSTSSKNIKSVTASAPKIELMDVRPDGKELDGIEGLPNEVWRLKSVQLLAAILATPQSSIRLRKTAARKAIMIEEAIYKRYIRMESDTDRKPVDFAAVNTGDDVNIKLEPGILHDNRPNVTEVGSSRTFPTAVEKRVYHNHVRSIIRNLRVKSNDSLRDCILFGKISAEALAQTDSENLMDPASLAQWKLAREELFRQSKVVAPLDSLLGSKPVDDICCPKCGNEQDNLQLASVQRHESSKSDIWGSKDHQDGLRDRFQCSKCSARF